MTASAITMMIVMLGVFWGGFMALLITALRRQPSEKTEVGSAERPQEGDERG